MTRIYRTFDQYFNSDPRVSVQSAGLTAVTASTLTESSNDITVPEVARDAVLLSLSGSEHHRVRIGDAFCDCPTAVHAVALVPRGVSLQSSWRVCARDLQTLSLEFDDGLFTAFTPELASDRFRQGHLRAANYGYRPGLAALTLLFQQELDPVRRKGRIFSDAITRLLAMEVASTCWSVPAHMPQGEHRRDRRVARAIDYIEAAFDRDISMIDLAGHACISPTALTTQFRRETGLTPYAYVLERRVRQAEHLLRTTDMPIAEVAIAVGFADQPHLTRIMRARRGTTPLAVRKGH